MQPFCDEINREINWARGLISARAPTRIAALIAGKELDGMWNSTVTISDLLKQALIEEGEEPARFAKSAVTIDSADKPRAQNNTDVKYLSYTLGVLVGLLFILALFLH
jgi:hypothetical protein